MSPLAQKIEALLFYAAEPLSFKVLGELCDVSADAIVKAVDEIEAAIAGHSLCVLRDSKTVSLVTTSEVSDVIEQYAKKDREAPLSPAASEVLAIVAYTNGVSKHEIDFIRGVNSQYTLRALMMRGLILKDGTDNGSVKYRGTSELLAFLGITSWDQLVNKKELIDSYHALLQSHEVAPQDGATQL